VRKIGATAEEPVDVRIISATHKNLEQLVEQGQFRQDLFYRLNVIELSLPPLRERLDDLGVLTDAILSRLGTFEQKVVLGQGVLDALRGYAFPGNVRELENILERALAFANDGVIEVGDLALKGARGNGQPAGYVPPPEGHAPRHDAAAATADAMAATMPLPAAPSATRAPEPAASATSIPPLPPLDTLPSNLPDYLAQVEREIIQRALAQTQYNRTQAAGLLGISFRQLRYQMQKLNIQEPDA
jgi:two-component system response regulator PilR (NtrC family)